MTISANCGACACQRKTSQRSYLKEVIEKEAKGGENREESKQGGENREESKGAKTEKNAQSTSHSIPVDQDGEPLEVKSTYSLDDKESMPNSTAVAKHAPQQGPALVEQVKEQEVSGERRCSQP
jgi:hypothetical protein